MSRNDHFRSHVAGTPHSRSKWPFSSSGFSWPPAMHYAWLRGPGRPSRLPSATRSPGCPTERFSATGSSRPSTARAARPIPSRSWSSTSTASRRSTTSAATTPATGCSRASHAGSSRSCGRATPSPGWAVTSSSSSRSVRARRTRRQRSWDALGRRSGARTVSVEAWSRSTPRSAGPSSRTTVPLPRSSSAARTSRCSRPSATRATTRRTRGAGRSTRAWCGSSSQPSPRVRSSSTTSP